MRILLIEDDRTTARSLEMMLNSQGFVVDLASEGEEGVEFATLYDYDAILLDLDLPDISGLEVLKLLRRDKVGTPIVFLTGEHEVETKIRAFSSGADDYVVKPAQKDELVARLRAVIRRSSGHAQPIITIGDLTLNLDAKIVHVNGTRVHLTGKEYQMLELLALRRGKTLNKEVFLNNLYGGMDEPGAKIIDVFICKLRQKLAKVSNNRHHIETVWGGGYVMRDPVEMQSAA